MTTRFKHRLEYGALVALRGLAVRLPYRAALAVGWLTAALAFYGARYRRAEAERRIRQVFDSRCSRRRARQVAWAAFRNLCFSAIDALRGSRIDAAWIARHVKGEQAFHAVLEQNRKGRAVLLAIPHMGSWELAASVCRLKGIPLFSIAARQKNPLFNDALNRQREQAGIAILTRGEVSFRAMRRLLESGRNFVVLPDVRNPTPALAIPFLGGVANIAAGMALFARQTGAPIYPCYLVRHGWTRHTIAMGDPVWPDPAQPREADLSRMTETVFRLFDEAIRKHPDQWFWFNKRWILDPVVPRSPAKAANTEDPAKATPASTPI